MTHRVDRERVVAALLNDDPDLIRRYHSSSTFRCGIDGWVEMVDTYIDGLCERSDEMDVAMAHQEWLVKNDPLAGHRQDDGRETTDGNR